ncbi:unnamed protein product, partial [Laminaria digitata]
VETACPAGQRELHEVHHAGSGSVLSSPIFQGSCCEEELDADDRGVLASWEPCSPAPAPAAMAATTATAAAATAPAATAAPAAAAATAPSSLQELERRRERNVGAGTTGLVYGAHAVGAASKKPMGAFDRTHCINSNSNSLPRNTRALTHAAALGTAINSANRPAPLRARFSPNVMEALPGATAARAIA